MAEIDLQNVKQDIADLAQTRNQLRQTVDSLGDEMMKLHNENKSLKEFAYRFRKSSKKYLMIKDIAKGYVLSLFSEVLGSDRKVLLGIALDTIATEETKETKPEVESEPAEDKTEVKDEGTKSEEQET